MSIRRIVVAAAGIAMVCGALACRREGKATGGDFRGAPIVLISIDTLRSDRLPAYGYGAVKTPAIDALAKEGIVYERAYSNVPLTLPSHASMLTGLAPWEHGVRNNIGYPWDTAKHPAVTAALKGAGYDTGAAVSAYVLRGGSGMASAFDTYDDAIAPESGVPVGRLQRPGTATLERARAWIDQRGQRPFFLLFHIFEPHAPWDAPEPWKSSYADPYDAEIAASDDIVGDLIAHLKAKGIWDRAVVILLSDHGEGLGDHGEDEHGVFLYREALQVPLIVKLPGGKRGGERVSTPVQLTDIAPTIAALAGVAAPAGAKGVNVLDPEALVPERNLYAETLYPRLHLGWSELRSLIGRQFHYIEAPRAELYDLVADPGETRDVTSDQRRAFTSMRDELATVPKEIAAPAAVDPEEAKKLAALGYVGAVRAADGDLPDPKDRIGDVEVLKKATYLSNEGRLAEAAALLAPLLSANPKFSDAWVLLANVRERMGHYQEAIDAYAGATRAAPTSASEYALSMADLFVRLKRFDEAKKHAELALSRNPAAAHHSLALVAMAAGDLATAEKEAVAASGDESTRPRALVALAQVKVRQGKPGEALRILEPLRSETEAKKMRVEKLDYALGDVYATMNRNLEAEQAFRREIAAFPSNLQAYSSLGVVLVIQKRFGEVDPLFEEMVRKNPTRQARLVAAETYEVLGDSRTAARWRNDAGR